ncbi:MULTISPECIES: DNA methyltransferase [Archaeoglobus]|nr:MULTISPECIES: DNA methyltransferase [Archaeoglobus]
MREVPFEEYLEYIKNHHHVVIEDTILEIGKKWEIKTFEPDDFELENTTVWSFPERGKWATHYLNAKYRGNWAPQIPRNLILRYTDIGDTVLDPFVGSGTTLIECKLLGRHGIGVDINYEAIMLSWDRLNFRYSPKMFPKLSYFEIKENEQSWVDPVIKLYHGDARNLDKIEDESIDLIAAHPPYANIISYTKGKNVDGDLSKMPITEYFKEMRKVATEFYRVLKPGKNAAILIGDTRKHKHYVPISFRVLECFLDAGFILREGIIKIQWKMKKTRERWRGKNYGFLLIEHEHIFVFRKPVDDRDYRRHEYSIKWGY